MHWSAVTCKPQTAEVNTFISLQCNIFSGKPPIQMFMWMPLDQAHATSLALPRSICTSSRTMSSIWRRSVVQVKSAQCKGAFHYKGETKATTVHNCTPGAQRHPSFQMVYAIIAEGPSLIHWHVFGQTHNNQSLIIALLRGCLPTHCHEEVYNVWNTWLVSFIEQSPH